MPVDESVTTKVVMYKLVRRIANQLETELKDEIAESDAARVDYVQLGKYTRSPVGINLAVHSDHPLGYGRDAIAEVGGRNVGGRGTTLPQESIGGSNWRYALGTVVIYSLIEGTSPSDAIQILECVKERIARCITNDATLLTLSDDYGWHVAGVWMADSFGYSGGGGDTAYDRHYCDFVALLSYPRVYS